MNQKGISLILIILIIVFLVIVGGIFWWLNYGWQSQYGLFCAKAGQTLSLSNQPRIPIIGKYTCCKGSIPIPSAPEEKYQEINGKYVAPPGHSIVCSDCGNRICEQWENKYSCPMDCVKDDTANWKTYRNEEYGFEVKYPADWELETFERNNIKDVINFNSPEVKQASPVFPQYNQRKISIRIYKNLNIQEEMKNEKLGAQIIDKNAAINETKIKVNNISSDQIELLYQMVGSKKNLEISTYVSYNNNIYKIHLLGFALMQDEQISKEIYNSFLSTFKFIK